MPLDPKMYDDEPWTHLARKAGFEPLNTESSAREAFRFCAELMATSPITPERFADFIPTLVRDPGKPECPLNRQLALEISEALGPDWCQTLYRFAVLCTKMQSIR